MMGKKKRYLVGGRDDGGGANDASHRNGRHTPTPTPVTKPPVSRKRY